MTNVKGRGSYRYRPFPVLAAERLSQCDKLFQSVIHPVATTSLSPTGSSPSNYNMQQSSVPFIDLGWTKNDDDRPAPVGRSVRSSRDLILEFFAVCPTF
jgi:hypothetical protein